jgi:hypothetical protein
MKNILLFLITVIFLSLPSCSDDGYEMLITDRNDAYIATFRILGTDNFTMLATLGIGTGIDTAAHTITGTVKYGTDLTKLKPYCSLSPESVIEPVAGSPKLGTWVDFTQGPFQYTVMSGSRKVKKTYTVTITAQP